MSERVKILTIYAISALFIILNTVLVYKELYWGIAIPIAIAIIFLYFLRLDIVLFFAVFATPLSINIGNYDLGASLSFPSEPLLIGILLFIILKILLEKPFDKQIFRHPVSIAISISLIWIFITACTSELPIVSFKFLISRIWFIIPIYLFGIILFRNKSNIKKFVWYYIAALSIVIVYTTVQHAGYGFSEKAGHWVMHPFYNDHTAYGAILALMIPVIIGFTLNKDVKKIERYLAFIASFILIMALYLSFSRAAWLSLIVAIGVLVLVIFKIKFRWIAFSVASLLIIFFTFKFEILNSLEKNKQDSSANFVEHIQSISNISSDASNLERINRWQSALRMFSQRPLLGFGPGTYQFEYAPFQRTIEKTIISTNLGDKGNAHSEYIGPMAEQGILGLINFLLIMITALYTGFKVYKKSNDKFVKVTALSITLALITYYAHGTMNNFLDTDKLSVPFWGLIAILVSLDLYAKNKSDIPDTQLTENTKKA